MASAYPLLESQAVEPEHQPLLAAQDHQGVEENVRASGVEAQQIKAALLEATGQDMSNLTQAQWDELIDRQRQLLAGEDLQASRAIPSIEEEVKGNAMPAAQ